MGMYCRVGLRIWQHDEKRPARKEETQPIIQALYDDKEANPNQEAQEAFDLKGESINEVKWYDIEKNLTLFSRKYPDYSFTIGQESTESEFEDSGMEFQTFHQGQVHNSHYYFQADLGYIDIDLKELFNPSFTLFENLDELKAKVIIHAEGNDFNIYIPTTKQSESKRLYRILSYQIELQGEQSDFYSSNISSYVDSICPFQYAATIKYYLPNLERRNKTSQDTLDFFWALAGKYLMGELN